MKALTCAFDAMSLPFLTQLRISTLDYINSQTWVNTFGKLPLLKLVRVKGCALHSFLDALVYKTMAAKKSKTTYLNVSFPKLRHIDLKGADFTGTDPRSISVHMLLDCLMERCERKAGVRLLRLQECYNIHSDDVERLEEVVGIVSEEEKDYDSDGNTIDSESDDLEDYDDFPLIWG